MYIFYSKASWRLLKKSYKTSYKYHITKNTIVDPLPRGDLRGSPEPPAPLSPAAPPSGHAACSGQPPALPSAAVRGGGSPRPRRHLPRRLSETAALHRAPIASPRRGLRPLLAREPSARIASARPPQPARGWRAPGATATPAGVPSPSPSPSPSPAGLLKESTDTHHSPQGGSEAGQAPAEVQLEVLRVARYVPRCCRSEGMAGSA